MKNQKNWVAILSILSLPLAALAQDGEGNMSLSQLHKQKNIASSFSVASSHSIEEQRACDAAEEALIELKQEEIEYNSNTEFSRVRSECQIREEGVSSNSQNRYYAVKATAVQSYRGSSFEISNYFFVIVNIKSKQVVGTALHKQLAH